jgi:circadian clock protein KaiC
VDWDAAQPIMKFSTGIAGFDAISAGGLPVERLTTVIGGPGAGKTVFAIQTLVHRLRAAGETGVFVSFEEPIPNIRRNIAGFAWGVAELPEDGIRFVDARIPVEMSVAGAFDLSGLLSGLGALVEEIHAHAVVFDGLDVLLTHLRDEQLERQEMLRLEQWIRASNLSAIVTVKTFSMSEREQSRSDFLQFMTDCVVFLESAYTRTTTSRSLRIGKYRGSGFAANPTPVVIGPNGIQIVALPGARAEYPAFGDRVSSGVERLDRLLGGGYVRGSSVLISGSPGTSKTSLSATFALATCEAGRRALFVSFDESAPQVVANMRSIGLDLAAHVASGRLIMESLLSSGRSPEEHLVSIVALLEKYQPDSLIIDPLSSLMRVSYPFADVVCEKLLDTAKTQGITALCTSLMEQGSAGHELSASNVSTIADTWIHLSYIARAGERNRSLTIVKSRGTDHSNQVRELMLDSSGIHVVDAYVAEGEVLMGSARSQREAEMHRQKVLAELMYRRDKIQLEHQLAELTARHKSISHELEWKRQEADLLEQAERDRLDREVTMQNDRLTMRRADPNGKRESPAKARKR